MSKVLEILDYYVRRNSALPKMQWLRDKLRKPYHSLLKRSRTGLPMSIGGVVTIRVPGEFCAKELEKYEVETAQALKQWTDENPGGLFVDIGSSYGYFSCAVLFNDPASTVIAIDADLPSLAITRYVCQFAPSVNQRLELFRALISNETSTKKDLEGLRDETSRLLSNFGSDLDPKQTNYVNLDTKISEEELPRITLDDFLSERLENATCPCMIKCDVEGAEQLVLEGGENTLRKFKPTLLVSVHPPYLPKFNGSVQGVRDLLESAGYRIDIIGIDHEEHWLCQ